MFCNIPTIYIPIPVWNRYSIHETLRNNGIPYDGRDIETNYRNNLILEGYYDDPLEGTRHEQGLEDYTRESPSHCSTKYRSKSESLGDHSKNVSRRPDWHRDTPLISRRGSEKQVRDMYNKGSGTERRGCRHCQCCHSTLGEGREKSRRDHNKNKNGNNGSKGKSKSKSKTDITRKPH